jgi:hypothetical protein
VWFQQVRSVAHYSSGDVRPASGGFSVPVMSAGHSETWPTSPEHNPADSSLPLQFRIARKVDCRELELGIVMNGRTFCVSCE